MSAPQRKRGSTLVLSMLVLLIFMGVTVSMTFNAQSQANLSNGLKLQQFYDIAVTSAMHRTRANLADYWKLCRSRSESQSQGMAIRFPFSRRHGGYQWS